MVVISRPSRAAQSEVRSPRRRMPPEGGPSSRSLYMTTFSVGSAAVGVKAGMIQLTQWKVPDLAFPFIRFAALRKQENILNRCPQWNMTAYFENTRHSLAGHDSAVRMRSYRGDVVREKNSVLI